MFLLLALMAAQALWFLDKHPAGNNSSLLGRIENWVLFLPHAAHNHVITILASMAGIHEGEAECGDVATMWVGVVFCAGLLIILLIWFEATELRGLRTIFEAPWSGLGQDVETAGMMEALLRLAILVAAVLLCLGLVSIAEAGDDTADTTKDPAMATCHLPKKESSKPPETKSPTVSLVWPPTDLEPRISTVPIVIPIEVPAGDNAHAVDAMDQSLKSLADIAAALKASVGQQPSVNVATELRLIDQHLVTLDAALRTSLPPLNIQVSTPGGTTECPDCCRSRTPDPPPVGRRRDPHHGPTVRCSTANLPGVAATPSAGSAP